MTDIQAGSNVSIFSKNELKAREAIEKLGLKPIPGITRVTFRKKNNQIFAIDSPEVFRSQGGNYIVFGEPKIDDFTQRLAKAQQQVASQTQDVSPAGSDAILRDSASIQADLAAATQSKPTLSADDDSSIVDETGLNAGDIELVMEQANVSRAKAVKALRQHDSDIVNAIMSLSK